MDRPRRIRGLRVAWSVWWGILCVLLVVLWVRSYWHPDSVTSVDSNLVLSRLGSNCGVFFFGAADYKTTPKIPPPETTGGWEYQAYDPPNASQQAWMLRSTTDHWVVSVPAWFATLIIMGLAIAPWLRFSLRTLLIATTVIAVVLGLIVYASQ